MKHALKPLAGLCLAAFASMSLPSAHAALHDRGNGLIFDDVLNVTWLQDANYAKTSGYGYANDSGAMTWQQAVWWADALVYKGLDDWRLPVVKPINGSTFNYAYSINGSTDVGYNIINPASELAYMHYVNLGNPGLFTPSGEKSGCYESGNCLWNSGPFSNISQGTYWTGTETDTKFRDRNGITFAWSFPSWGYQQQNLFNKNTWLNAWAVRDGDVTLLAYKVKGANDQLFSGNSGVVAIPSGTIAKDHPIGFVSQSMGNAWITRSDGSSVYELSGAPVYFGDKIETDAHGAANIIFHDNTVFAVPNDAAMSIDEFVYDPDQDGQGEADISVVRGVFVYYSGFVGKEDPADVHTKTPVGTLGIRGDASDYINNEYLDLSVKMNVGSPITLSKMVDVPTGAFDLSFEYMFLTDTGWLTVQLGDAVLQTFSGSIGAVGKFQQAHVNVSASDILALGTAKLSFTFDGPHGSQLIIDGISMPGLANGDFDYLDAGWTGEGPGSLELVATISDTKWNEITAVPEPETYALMLAGLGLVGFAARRRRV